MKTYSLSRGFLEAEGITKNFAKTFYLASVFLPKDKRLASYAVYAICRQSDESVDNIQAYSEAENLNKINKRMKPPIQKRL